MEQILIVYGLPKATVTAIMMLHKNRKSMVRSPELFNIVSGTLQGDTLALYLFILCLEYILWTSINLINENGLPMKKERSRQYPTKTMTDADYADNRALLKNTKAQAKFQLHSL